MLFKILLDWNTKDGLGHLGSLSERRLLAAVLQRAILDYFGNDENESEDAKAWIFQGSKKSEASRCNFAWVCEQLGLNLEKVRVRLSLMKSTEIGSTFPRRFR